MTEGAETIRSSRRRRSGMIGRLPKTEVRHGVSRRPAFRAEHIGSLIRPPAVLAAREDRAAGRIDAAALRAVEDAEIARSVAAQAALGFRCVSDGEFRRHSYTDSFGVAVFGGLRTARSDDPDWRYTNRAGETSAPTSRSSRTGWSGRARPMSTISPISRRSRRRDACPR